MGLGICMSAASLYQNFDGIAMKPGRKAGFDFQNQTQYIDSEKREGET